MSVRGLFRIFFIASVSLRTGSSSFKKVDANNLELAGSNGNGLSLAATKEEYLTTCLKMFAAV